LRKRDSKYTPNFHFAKSIRYKFSVAYLRAAVAQYRP
jgi:hypothetical protein